VEAQFSTLAVALYGRLSPVTRPSSCILMKMCRLNEKLDGPQKRVRMRSISSTRPQPRL